MFKGLKSLIMTTAACAAMAGAAGAAAPALPQAVHTVEGIKSYELVNGLKVVLFADQSKPTATVNTTYLVGSRHENYGETLPRLPDSHTIWSTSCLRGAKTTPIRRVNSRAGVSA